MTRTNFLALILAVITCAGSANAQTTIITYQGRLMDGAAAADGIYEMQFKMFDTLDGPTQIGSTVTNSSVTVSDGVFTVNLDFPPPSPFAAGANRFLEIAVRKTTDPPDLTILSPRQQILSTPYAIRTLSASAADSLSNACVGCVSIGHGGTGASSPAAGRTNLGAAESGTNSDITELSGLTTPLSISQGGTGSQTKNFVDLSTTQNIGGAKTFANGLSVTGNAAISGGLDFSSRLVKTASMTGTDFVNNTLNGSNVCPANYHPITAWEAMVIDMLAPTNVFDEQGWVAGSFSNVEIHMRSLVNGQDSIVCPVGSYLTKFPSTVTHGEIETRGGLHCSAATWSRPVWCIQNRGT